jgi:large subunit ribosomal protein L23
MNVYEVIKRPVITEKTQYQADVMGKYTFEVDLYANKTQVKQAVEEIYGATVTAVNTMVMPAKTGNRTGRGYLVRQPVWKKAVVTVAEGETIAWFEGG